MTTHQKMIDRITREMLRDWGACYDDDEIAELVPPDGVTPLEVCDATMVPAADRLWVLLRDQVIPAQTLRLLAVRWARGALEAERAAGREPDERSWTAADVAERYAHGEATQAELAAASDAARYAAIAAASAAHAAAWAAWAAAWAVAWAAAANAAAWAAAWAELAASRDAAARAAAWAAQLADARRALTGGAL